MKNKDGRNWEFRNYRDQDGTENRELYITGEISAYSWWGDETTPDEFEEQLYGGKGDVDLWISSPGGDVFAAAEIYNSISQYTGGKVRAYVYGLCASAATVIAMAAKEIYMSPTALMLIHNPSTVAYGESDDMRRTAAQLDVVKETIINAYVIKTGLTREELSVYMEEEKAFDATEAIELGFADGFIESEQDKLSLPEDKLVLATNSVAGRFYNSVRDWKLAFQAKTDIKAEKQEEESMTGQEENKALDEQIIDENPVVEDVAPKEEVPKEEVPKEEVDPATAVSNKGTVSTVDITDWKAVVNELKSYKEQASKEIAELREYKAQQEAEIKAKDLIGLPGITDERRLELARTADDKLFEDLKAIATFMNELTEPIGVTTPSDIDDSAESKGEAELRKKIEDYAAEHGVPMNDAFLAVTNGGGK